MLGNEGAYFPSDGTGKIPEQIWRTVTKSLKDIDNEGIIKTEKDKEQLLEAIRALLTPSDKLPIDEIVSSEELIKMYEKASQTPVEFKGLSTGLATLDQTLLGIQDQNFLIICARTGVGKTLIANYLVAKFAEQGEKILYLALEESADEVGDRWAKIVGNNHFNVPGNGVGFLYSEKISAIKENKYNIISLVATASKLGYTMICVDMLNNLIDTVRDENANTFLNRLLDQVHKTGMTLIMTARLRQPMSDREKDFPTMESVYGRVDLGYIVSKCIALTQMEESTDGCTYLRTHVLKNRRKQIGQKALYPILRVNNLLEITDVGDDSTAAELLDNYDNGIRPGARTSSTPPKGKYAGGKVPF